MGILDALDLPSLNEEQRKRRAIPKHEIASRVVTQEQKKQTKAKREKELRELIWTRDKGICRATGVPLSKSGLDPHKVGEVDHTLLRSTHPEHRNDPSNMLLISKYLNRLRKVHCRHAPEFLRFDYSGPADRSQPQHFVWRDDFGTVIKEHIG